MGNNINICLKEFNILYQENLELATWFGFCGWR